MRQFKDRVAVVTGGASGIGRAMALRFAREGMKVVLADIEGPALEATEREFRDLGLSATGVLCDVSKARDVEALAQAALRAHNGVHVVCNNAGVAPLGLVWEHSVKDWEWALGVNVWGVIHGIRVFTPILLRQGDEGHIVNTASVAGLLSLPGMGMYCLTKHAVVALTETLYHDLTRRSDRVRCSVLCPAYVPTRISDSERNRPPDLRDGRTRSEEEQALEQQLRHAVQSGRISAEQVADMVLEAIRAERFYILPHQRIKGAIETRMQDILMERAPTDTLKR
ncbi:MAG TPA: SDR family oxidoreductase [Burkholderiales bacterium]|jgi:NAD(P)-dependent dehydrogenase (short-subunit alcohol dehydrogenase family)|nr:SDR family oxidoreductase [Burkholderiales bacterium]